MATSVPLEAGENGSIPGGAAEALAMLRRALNLLDERGAPPIVGARVQEAIDAAEEWGIGLS